MQLLPNKYPCYPVINHGITIITAIENQTDELWPGNEPVILQNANRLSSSVNVIIIMF